MQRLNLPAAAPLDDTDRKLLRALQQDGRATAEALAGQVHLSPRATLARLRSLEKSRWIEGYRAVVNPAALGSHVTVLAEVTMRDQRREAAQAFERRMRETRQVVACDLVSGRYDYLVRLCCEDLAQYQSLTNAWLDDIALGIERIASNTQLAPVKEFAGWPL